MTHLNSCFDVHLVEMQPSNMASRQRGKGAGNANGSLHEPTITLSTSVVQLNLNVFLHRFINNS